MSGVSPAGILAGAPSVASSGNTAVAGKIYQRGHIVQRNRRYWLALVETSERPAESSDWREFPVSQEHAA